MSWTALIPLKADCERKSRLAGRLSIEQRQRLSAAMADHVIDALRRTSEIDRLVVLSPVAPEASDLEWVRDFGRGLNAEIAEYRETGCGEKLLIIHGDLPTVGPADIRSLITRAEITGAALAPDRHGSGTNALALADSRSFEFAFGPGSCDHHFRQGTSRITKVERPGLQLDIDAPEDLDAATALGCVFDFCVGEER